jgi:hypothetical protein
MKIGVEDGVGRYPDRFTGEERAKAIIPDRFRHEIGSVFHLKGRGHHPSCTSSGCTGPTRLDRAVWFKRFVPTNPFETHHERAAG